MLKKHFKTADCEFYGQFSCRKRMFPTQSHRVECKVCLGHAGGLRRQNLFLVIIESAFALMAPIQSLAQLIKSAVPDFGHDR